jgi:23S rRNA pseudouridine1911/1915/1917 synthase
LSPPDEPADSATRFTVRDGEADRVDRVIARRLANVSRRRIVDLIAEGAVRVDGKRAKKGDHVAAGAVVELAHAPATADDLRAGPDAALGERLTVLYVDDDVVVIDKPPGLPSQPLRPGELGTAANAIVARFPECAAVSDDPRDGGLVHRLDRGTSGALAAARTRAAWLAMRAAFAERRVEKSYLALVDTAPVSTECEAPLVQRGNHAAVDHTDGLEAHTRWTTVEKLGERRLLRCTALTGRMHQVRVHLATCGAPITGDTLYGGAPLAGLIGFFLHAERLALPGRPTVDAPLPPDRAAVLAALRTGG